eukprot:COSAG02_NODE_14073_length_1313_cov_2.206755_1_plen_33_part_10
MAVQANLVQKTRAAEACTVSLGTRYTRSSCLGF